jgi:uncharacterized protein (DUF1800 family)
MALIRDSDLMAAIAVTRFGLGARPGEIEAARGDPAGFLKAQIRPEGADQPPGDLGSSSQNLEVFTQLRRARKEEKADDAAAALKATGVQIRDLAINEMAARGALAAQTPAAFRERWTLFWSNHFTVSALKGTVAPIAGAFEREAIRPHVFGRFEDMLQASTRHPAMLLYLDQSQSAGPNSLLGQRRSNAGLNENLGREIMELHTVGLGAGYTQADVTEFARALTGWSISRGQGELGAMTDRGPNGAFMYRPALHEPGPRTVLGKSYPQDGEDQARAILHDLAYHPATADHIAAKLARHFVADDPPPALQARLKASFIAGGGRLDQVARTLIDSPEAWQPQAAKFKTPYEFLISAWRASGQAPDMNAPQKFVGSLTLMGQRPFSPDSPKGWSDEAADWASADGVVKRLAWSEQAAAAMTAQGLDPNAAAKDALGARLTPLAAQAIQRAETRQEAFAVLLMSPEFQRR